MKVSAYMSDNITCVDASDSIVKAAAIMKEKNVGAVPVEKDNKLVGMLTDRDITLRAVAENKSNLTCGEVMTTEVKSISKEDDIDKVVDYMSKYQIRRVPVTDNGKVIGMVSIGDLTDSEMSDELIGEVVTNVSK